MWASPKTVLHRAQLSTPPKIAVLRTGTAYRMAMQVYLGRSLLLMEPKRNQTCVNH
jgi:hypothetical protein